LPLAVFGLRTKNSGVARSTSPAHYRCGYEFYWRYII
jgi:hypothetical protein